MGDSERARILVVEDEPDVRQGLRRVFEAEGFEVVEAANGAAGLEMVASERPRLVVLDLMIPGVDGLGVCREIRARGLKIPILILTAKSGEIDKVLGFELGADDYVTKPFSVLELIARVKALLRRAEPQPGETNVLDLGDARVDLERYEVTRNGEITELYHYEAEILRLLVRREGRIVARDEILDKVWGEDSFPTARTIDFHVCNLRKKVEVDPRKPRHSLTAHGVGYRFVR